MACHIQLSGHRRVAGDGPVPRKLLSSGDRVGLAVSGHWLHSSPWVPQVQFPIPDPPDLFQGHLTPTAFLFPSSVTPFTSLRETQPGSSPFPLNPPLRHKFYLQLPPRPSLLIFKSIFFSQQKQPLANQKTLLFKSVISDVGFSRLIRKVKKTMTSKHWLFLSLYIPAIKAQILLEVILNFWLMWGSGKNKSKIVIISRYVFVALLHVYGGFVFPTCYLSFHFAHRVLLLFRS